VTLEVDCAEIVRRCEADVADAAILVANCPVCHQTLGLVARALEERAIATVVMGCAKDIVEYVGVPRLLFSDFPLGPRLEARLLQHRAFVARRTQATTRRVRSGEGAGTSTARPGRVG